VQVVGEEGTGQLQDFSPLAEYKGTLPVGGAVIVAVEVMDKLGAVSQPTTIQLISQWPKLESEDAATAATAALLGSAEAALKAGGPEAGAGHSSTFRLNLSRFLSQTG
jgi:hypothetical protein